MLADQIQTDPMNLLFRMCVGRRPVAPTFMAHAKIAILIRDCGKVTLFAPEEDIQEDGSIFYGVRYRVASLAEIPITELVWHVGDAVVPVIVSE